MHLPAKEHGRIEDSVTNLLPMRQQYPARGEGVSLVEASEHELVVEGFRPRFKLMH